MKVVAATSAERLVAHAQPAAVNALICLKLLFLKTLLLGVGFFCAQPGWAQKKHKDRVRIEGATAYYTEPSRQALILSGAGLYETRKLWRGPGRISQVNFGYTGKYITFNNPEDLLEEQLDGETSILEHSVTASADQGLAIGSQIGALVGLTNSPLSDSFYYGIRGGQWFLQETLQTSLRIQSTQVKQQPVEFTDTDGKRVITPQDLEGINLGLSITHFTTPTTIILASVSHTDRSDRPPANSSSVELRQFLKWTNSAIHFSMVHYENVGEIEPVTATGAVVANAAELEWHQRLPSKMILSGGYKYYLENEDPRARDAARNQLGSDTIFASLRWRWGRGAWTAELNEVYGFASRYSNNRGTEAFVAGVGGHITL